MIARAASTQEFSPLISLEVDGPPKIILNDIYRSTVGGRPASRTKRKHIGCRRRERQNLTRSQREVNPDPNLEEFRLTSAYNTL